MKDFKIMITFKKIFITLFATQLYFTAPCLALDEDDMQFLAKQLHASVADLKKVVPSWEKIEVPHLFAPEYKKRYLILKQNEYKNQKFPYKKADASDFITIAILVKDKAIHLPLYLACIEEQTWPKNKTYLYIRTNNNTDNSAQILKEWIEEVKDEYAGFYFDDTDIKAPVHLYKKHEWNVVRFKALGKIRQDSMDWAASKNSHYFVADCDNFIKQNTIQAMIETNLPIVAPFLRCKSNWSNYYTSVNSEGYEGQEKAFYNIILNQKIKHCVKVPLVHCTYFVRKNAVPKMIYDDQSSRWEYAIFSDNARKKYIDQYIDNREIYGYLTAATIQSEAEKEPWMQTPWLKNIERKKFACNS